MLCSRLIIDISQEFFMIWGNYFPFEFAQILEVTIGRRKEETLRSCIRIRSKPILAEAVHFLIEIIDGEAIGFNFTREVFFCLIGLLKGYKIIFLLDFLIARQCQMCDISIGGDIDWYLILLQFLAEAISVILTL